jgi:hypothetical protein
MKTPMLALLFCCVAVPALTAQEKKDAPPATEMQMPKPGKEHQLLASAAGNWDVAIEMAGMPASKGTATIEMAMNGFWRVEHFKGEMGGMPFEGRGVTGFDPIKGKYVATWVDSMAPALTVTEGTYDEKAKTLTMIGDGYNETGQKAKYKFVHTTKDADHFVFELSQVGGDGKDVKVLTINYTRRK